MKRISLLLAFVVAASMFIVSCGGESTAAEATDENTQEEVVPAEETPAVAETPTEEPVAVVTTTDLANGEAIYKKTCFACHDTESAGAAKLETKERWEITAAKGLELVNKNALEGYTGDFGIMLAKGGNASLTDQEVLDAVAYMLDKAGVIAE